MRFLITAILILVLVPTPSFAIDTFEDLTDEHPLWDVISPQLPDDADDIQFYSYPVDDITYLVVQYCYDIDENEMLGVTLNDTSTWTNYEMLMGYVEDGEFLIEFADTRENRAYGAWFYYEKVEFGVLEDKYGEQHIMVVKLSEWGGGTGHWPSIDAYSPDFHFSTVVFTPGIAIGDRRGCDFEIREDLNGVIVWESCAIDGDGRWPPFRITQSLYQVNPWAGLELYLVKRITTEEPYDYFPDEPPFDW